MSTWITDENGKWHPAKERVALKNLSGKTIKIKRIIGGKDVEEEIRPGDDYIYEGPDRAALFDWWEQNGKPSAEQMKKLEGQVTLGEDFRQNTEFLEAYAKARNAFGFKDVAEYLTYLGYDFDKVKSDFEKKASVVNRHDLPKKINEIKKLGGGGDSVDGRLNKFGGFGEPEESGMARR